MYQPTIQQIRYFLTVANNRSFSLAAEALFVTQPAVSKWILRLEKDMGVTLFDRTPEGIELTAVGKYLYDEWERIILQLDRSVQTALNWGDGKKSLRVLCLDLPAAKNCLLDMLALYKAKYPEVTISFEVCQHEEMIRELLRGSADVAIGLSFLFEAKLTELRVEGVREVKSFVIVSRNNPLSEKEMLSKEDLKTQTMYYVSDEIYPASSEIMFNTCKKYGFEPKETQGVHTQSTLLTALGSGSGFAFMVGDGSESELGIKEYEIEAATDETASICVASLKGRGRKEIYAFYDLLANIR